MFLKVKKTHLYKRKLIKFTLILAEGIDLSIDILKNEFFYLIINKIFNICIYITRTFYTTKMFSIIYLNKI